MKLEIFKFGEKLFFANKKKIVNRAFNAAVAKNSFFTRVMFKQPL